MKKTCLLLAMLATAICTMAQGESFFRPVRESSLRLPAVPLVLNDPYFSIWSPYDHLNDGATRLWTNDVKPLEGMLRVDGKTYRFMGSPNMEIMESIAPMADEAGWQGRYTRQTPAEGWQKPDFDDSQWQRGEGAFGSEGNTGVRTRWADENSDIYVRRSVQLTDVQLAQDLYLIFSHDDNCEVYINGTQVATGPATFVEGTRLHLDAQLKALLHKGDNTLAMHVRNNAGGALCDLGIYRNIANTNDQTELARQTSVTTLATSTFYTFECGKVSLDLIFTAPMLIDNLDLLSTPINYISYRVTPKDQKAHQVDLLLTASPLIAVNKATQPTRSERVIRGGITYLRTGTIDQPILAKKGDGIGIDWGYLYLPAINGEVSLAAANDVVSTFTAQGSLPESQQRIDCRRPADLPLLGYVHHFGTITAPAASFAMIGYDEVQDIEYMYHRYKAYWAHQGRVSIFDAFQKLKDQYQTTMIDCRELDRRIYDDGLQAGDRKYAELLSASYRHVVAAHKLFEDKDGNLLFFSKENNSNGCVNTVDLTYPEAPLWLCYNPALQKAMMTSILDYSLSGRWTKPFAAHDLGTYPIANGQVYGGDMPLEEAGNIIILCAQLTRMDGNTKYVDKYWNILRTWADYLSENGQDPANQLCTDDFAGHWAHNCNLSIKAIMGVAAFAEMARIKGDKATADKYMKRAHEMGVKWEKDAREGDHYRLAFDRPDTWSMKYNMVWDKLWGTGIFPKGTMQREVKSYMKRMNRYGLPLDIRKDYTKNDWILWTAAMTDSNKDFLKLMTPVWNYVNETQTRVPISDWYDTKTGLQVGFKARSVIGGFWMKVLAEKMK